MNPIRVTYVRVRTHSAEAPGVFTVRLRARKPEREGEERRAKVSSDEEIGQVPSSFVKYDRGSFLFYAAMFSRTF